MQKDLLVVLLFISVLLPVKNAKSQNVEYGIKVDTSSMMIGDQQTLSFIVKSDKPLKLEFPALADNFVKGIEIISGPECDSTKKDSEYIYEQRYRITAFDTGVYRIPSLCINIKNEGFNHPLHTEELVFGVNTFNVDMEKGLLDVQQPYDVPLTFKEILPYILYTLLALLLIALLVYVFVKHRRGEKIFSHAEEVIPPYERALQGIGRIKERKLWIPGNEKTYYTELTEVMRQYISGELDVPCMEATSDQIMEGIADNEHITAQDREFIGELLSSADLVKFAKMLPLQDENVRYFEGVCKTVEKIHDSVIKSKSEEIC